MNKYNKILMAALLIFMAVACAPESDLELALDLDRIEIGPEGGARILNVSSSEHWVASTQEPWITISPANGRGTAQCKVMIDSTLIQYSWASLVIQLVKNLPAMRETWV